MSLQTVFLRLPLMEKPTAGDKELQSKARTLIDFKNQDLSKDSEEILDGEKLFTSDYNREERSMTRESFVNLTDQQYTKCRLNLPNPITTINIINHQARDIRLQEQVRAGPDHYTHEEIHTFDIIVYIANPNQPRVWKIVLPESIIQDVLKWYVATVYTRDLQHNSGPVPHKATRPQV